MLSANGTVLVLVDIQGKLAEVMHEKEILYANARRLVQGMRILDVPIVWTEQVPEKMGPTVPQIAELLSGYAPLHKTSFSCCGDENFMAALSRTGRGDVVLAGIETHVCVCQTASDLVSAGYAVHVVADAVSSRTLSNRQIGLEKSKAAGAALTGTETVLFELLRAASHPAFREILKIVR